MTTYGVEFAVECPLCKEIIPVGYAGPNGLGTCSTSRKEKMLSDLRTETKGQKESQYTYPIRRWH